jgi:hypothetical protein
MQASLELGINYSTAKTIMFFHRKPDNAWATLATLVEPEGGRAVAAIAPSTTSRKIEIVSSVGRVSWADPGGLDQEGSTNSKIDTSL